MKRRKRLHPTIHHNPPGPCSTRRLFSLSYLTGSTCSSFLHEILHKPTLWNHCRQPQGWAKAADRGGAASSTTSKKGHPPPPDHSEAHLHGAEGEAGGNLAGNTLQLCSQPVEHVCVCVCVGDPYGDRRPNSSCPPPPVQALPPLAPGAF